MEGLMSNKLIFDELMSLDQLKIFNKSDLQLLDSFCITSVAELLGATKGLMNIEIFKEMEIYDEKILKLKQIIPDVIISSYTNFSKKYPMGEMSIESNAKE